MNRRAALKTLGPAAGAFLLDGCVRRGSEGVPGHPPELLHLPRVDVRPELEIRTVVGLRPFRPSGFVVRAENVGDKLVVHNYGHGGGGVTLSWGTSELAARLVREASGARVAVLGSGAVGLATSRLLQERGYSVTIYAKDLPPNTTSNTAGAQWYPFLVYEREHATPAFMQQFVEAAGIANRRLSLIVGEGYGVRWRTKLFFSPDPHTSGKVGARHPLPQ